MKPATAPALQAWWRQREPRERRMLLLMSAALAAFVLWFGAYRPLAMAATRATAAHARAAAAMDQAREDAAMLQRAAAQPAPARGDLELLRTAVLASATRAGLPVSRHATEADGLRIEADATTPRQLLGWLDHLRTAHALAPETLSAAQSEGRLRVQARFVAAPLTAAEP